MLSLCCSCLISDWWCRWRLLHGWVWLHHSGRKSAWNSNWDRGTRPGDFFHIFLKNFFEMIRHYGGKYSVHHWILSSNHQIKMPIPIRIITGLKWNFTTTYFYDRLRRLKPNKASLKIKPLTPLLDFHEKPPPSNRFWRKAEAGKRCHLMNRDQWKISRQTHPLCFCHIPNLADPVLICAKPSHKTQHNEEHLGVKLKQYACVPPSAKCLQIALWCTSRWITRLQSARDVTFIWNDRPEG